MSCLRYYSLGINIAILNYMGCDFTEKYPKNLAVLCF